MAKMIGHLCSGHPSCEHICTYSCKCFVARPIMHNSAKNVQSRREALQALRCKLTFESFYMCILVAYEGCVPVLVVAHCFASQLTSPKLCVGYPKPHF